MDTLANITYRAWLANDSAIRENVTPGHRIGSGVTGSIVDSWDFSDVDVTQFLEKRSEQDGSDAGDVFLGNRRLRMSGSLFGRTRALLFDQYWQMLAALNPVLAQRESPADKGYCPLYFSVPTNDVVNYPDLVIPLRVLALPRAKQVIWQRDSQGGKATDPIGIPWSATFLMKDPNIYAQDPQDYDLVAHPTGLLVNRGTYITRPNMLIVVGAEAGTITAVIGGTTMVITVPASTGNRTIRYKGQDKILTVEEGAIEVLRLDLLSLGTQQSHPIVPPVGCAYSVTGMTFLTGSHLWLWEVYAG